MNKYHKQHGIYPSREKSRFHSQSEMWRSLCPRRPVVRLWISTNSLIALLICRNQAI